MSKSTFLGLIEEIPGISVDCFKHKNLTSSAFFLSHCHFDHMDGLGSTFFEYLKKHKRYLYCSPISKIILQNRFKLNECSNIKDINIDTTIIIEYNDNYDKSNIISVSSISAGHCFGSVMFLFEKDGKSILYTGDFRINPIDFPKLKLLHTYNGSRAFPKKFDKIYLDTTFLTPDFSYFPTRQESVLKIQEVVNNWLDQDPNNVVMLQCSALYGSEFLFIELSKSLKRKIHVKQIAYENYCHIIELIPHITIDSHSTPIHACGRICSDCLCNIDKKYILTIIPSVLRWQGKNTSIVGEWDEYSENTFNVCYATHSSFEELKAFLQYFNPIMVFPCVIPYNQKIDVAHTLKEILNTSNNKIVKNKPKFKLMIPSYQPSKTSISTTLDSSDDSL